MTDLWDPFISQVREMTWMVIYENLQWVSAGNRTPGYPPSSALVHFITLAVLSNRKSLWVLAKVVVVEMGKGIQMVVGKGVYGMTLILEGVTHSMKKFLW